MIKRIPFAPFPVKQMKIFSEPFKGIGKKINKMFPGLEKNLLQAGTGINAETYSSMMAFSLLFYFAIFSVVFIIVFGKIITSFSLIGGVRIPHFILLGLVVALAVAGMMFFQMLMYPKMQIKKRVRAIENNLVFALRAMLVQIKSGVSLFNALSMIAASKRFGQLSEEFKGAVDNISTGMAEEKALQQIASKNPSPYLRKAIWQIINGMKAGADVSDVLGESLSSIVREQQIGIEKYGNSLKILSLMYLMIGVIIPALGITFLIVIGSFPKIQIEEVMFWVLLAGLILAEFMFMGIMKSKRPNLMSD